MSYTKKIKEGAFVGSTKLSQLRHGLKAMLTDPANAKARFGIRYMDAKAGGATHRHAKAIAKGR